MRQSDVNELESVCQLAEWKLTIMQISVTFVILLAFIAPAFLVLYLFREYTLILVGLGYAYLKFTEIVPESVKFELHEEITSVNIRECGICLQSICSSKICTFNCGHSYCMKCTENCILHEMKDKKDNRCVDIRCGFCRAVITTVKVSGKKDRNKLHQRWHGKVQYTKEIDQQM